MSVKNDPMNIIYFYFTYYRTRSGVWGISRSNRNSARKSNMVIFVFPYGHHAGNGQCGINNTLGILEIYSSIILFNLSLHLYSLDGWPRMCDHGSHGWVQKLFWQISHQSGGIYWNGYYGVILSRPFLCNPGNNEII